MAFGHPHEQVSRPGIEPGSPPSEGGIVIRWTTRTQTAEGEGVEPSYPCGRRRSKPVRYQFRTPFQETMALAEPVPVDPPGVEPGSPACRAGVVPLDHKPIGAGHPDHQRSGIAGS